MSQAKNNNIPYLAFIIPTSLVLITLGILLLTIPKGELHLLLCQPHTAMLDQIVPVFTNLVDWLPYVTVVLLLFYRAGWATFLASNLLPFPSALSHHEGMIHHRLQYRNGMHQLHPEE